MATENFNEASAGERELKTASDILSRLYQALIENEAFLRVGLVHQTESSLKFDVYSTTHLGRRTTMEVTDNSEAGTFTVRVGNPEGKTKSDVFPYSDLPFLIKIFVMQQMETYAKDREVRNRVLDSTFPKNEP